MLKAKILRAVATGATGLVLVAGTGAAYATQGRFHRGHDDRNSGNSVDVDNDTRVNVDNNTNQDARSGDAKVQSGNDCKDGQEFELRRVRNHRDHKNDCDEGAVLGDATTGAASNDNTTGVSVSVSNDPCACVADSNSRGGSKVEIDNDTHIDIDNTTRQDADSGDATVNGNGNATTGDASNSNSTTISVSVSN